MEGKIVRIFSDKGFGFIRDTTGVEYFFHKNDYNGFFDDLIEDARTRAVMVEFDPDNTDKGPRARNVIRPDGGV